MSDQGIYVDLGQLLAIEHQCAHLGLNSHKAVNTLLQGTRRSKIKGNGINFEEARPYQLGDDVRHIDWKVTARLQSTYVKVFTEELERPVIVMVDQRQDMFAGTRHMLKSYAAAMVAGYFTWMTHKAGDRAGFVLFDDQQIEMTPVKGHIAHLMRSFDQLVSFNRRLSANNHVISNEAQLEAALAKLQAVSVHDAIVVLISDFIGFNEACLHRIHSLQQHCTVIAVPIHDYLDQHWPDAGEYLACQNGQFGHFNLSNPAVNRDVQQLIARRIETTEQLIAQTGASTLLINTDSSVENQIRTRLKEAGLL
ncbi:DUF58 domain-containing protein [Endozoicomonas sp.]|uniref:DUF58 domain-containing protein n=1 Tax=Endozoicomonas sp. TaxID=1892382 RepID=UPI0028843516|nr:DUF58 domain-containing protein [Endozoicomonas sp.]